MDKKTLVASVVSLLLVGASTAMAHNPAPPPGMEKCYGIAAAGKNECGTKMHSCAGLSKKNNDPDSWVFVPKGTCKKKGGATSPRSEWKKQ